MLNFQETLTFRLQPPGKYVTLNKNLNTQRNTCSYYVAK